MGRRVIVAVLLVVGSLAYAQQPATPQVEKKYSVVGMVIRPGEYSLNVPTTVLEALVNARGFQDYANKRKIVIQRGDTQLEFNYNEVIGGKKPEQNVLLRPGDVIVVK